MPKQNPVRVATRGLRARSIYLTPRRPELGLAATGVSLGPVEMVAGLNEPESRIYHALVELRVLFEVQAGFYGNNYLGGARADFLLTDYRIDLEYQGPYHGTAYGTARDVLRNLGVEKAGYRVEFLYEEDLPRLKERIVEIIGVPL